MRPILKNKLYLYLTEFFAGMSVMAVELGASRLLAPYFSSSQIVWTIIIGTIMIAMALGNVYGGRQADRDPNPDRLYRRILIAAVWIGLIPVLGKYVILGVSALLIFTVNSNLLIWAGLVSCLVLFVYPLFLLGTVTPSLAKYTMDNLDSNARIVGTLGAANTVGSIIGTFVPTFVTIPAVGTAITFLIFALILLLLALAYFFSGKGRRVGCWVALALFGASCLLGHRSNFAFWKSDLLFEGESVYNYLQVEETDENIILSTNVLFGVQSILPKNGTLTGMYYDYALAAPLMAGSETHTGPLSLLVLGMGTGTYANQCLRYFPGMEVEGVEIDGKITALARRYFALSDDVPVATYDGRAWLNVVDRSYDVILVDAYQDITIPFQMASVEFFTLIREHLSPGGVMVVNMNMRDEREGNMNQHLADTIAAVFPSVYTVDVPGMSNRELFASCEAALPERLAENAALCGDAALRGLMARVGESLEPWVSGGRIMTDDRAPVELLSMRMIDSLIQDELRWYKALYAEQGLSGLMASLGIL